MRFARGLRRARGRGQSRVNKLSRDLIGLRVSLTDDTGTHVGTTVFRGVGFSSASSSHSFQASGRPVASFTVIASPGWRWTHELSSNLNISIQTPFQFQGALPKEWMCGSAGINGFILPGVGTETVRPRRGRGRGRGRGVCVCGGAEGRDGVGGGVLCWTLRLGDMLSLRVKTGSVLLASDNGPSLWPHSIDSHLQKTAPGLW